MSKKLFYVLIVPLTILQSCVDQNTPETTFNLLNNSTKDIIIKPYSRNRVDGVLSGGSISAEIINVSSGEKKSFLREQRDNRTFYSIKNIDLVKIIFDNQKILILTCDDWPDMSSCNTIFRGNDNYQHFITEEDYNTAEDCNGNCD